MMSSFFEYLMQASIVFTALYIAYWLLFSKQTFHKLNRFVLLFILLASIGVPMLNVPNYFAGIDIENSNSFQLSPFDGWMESSFVNDTKSNQSPWPITHYLFIFYLLGIVLFTLRFFMHLNKIRKIKQLSTPICINNKRVWQTTKTTPPFSFFNAIFLPSDAMEQQQAKSIIEHENAHAKQLHTLDLLITEIFSIFLWFVPFVYSFKNSVKNVHEYLADGKVTQQTRNLSDYLNLLANETEKYTLIGLSSNFYCKTLKNRITMITKNKSKKVGMLRYAIILPIVALLTFACNINNTKNSSTSSAVLSKNQTPSVVPVKGNYEISSGYGKRMHPIKKKITMHNAIDFKAKAGTPVVATASGKVIKSDFFKDSYGELIVIEHDNTYATLYAQLQVRKVQVGDIVKQGDVIGLVGSSGMSTGPHLHYEVKKDGENVNPADYLK